MTRLIPLLILLLVWATPVRAWVRSATVPARCTTHATDCTALTCATSNDGDMCCELDDDTVYFCDGAEGSYVTSAAASGDITAVGDITSGAAFTATAGNDGTTLYFEGSTADGNEIALTSADPGSDITVTIPATAGNLVTTGDNDTVTATMLAAADFGDWTCSAGDSCTLDTDSVSDNEIDYTTVTCAKITMSDCDETITTSGDLVANGSDLTLNAAGVKLTGDGDGALTILGLGDGANEDITINLDDTANFVTLTSSTGVITIDINGPDLRVTNTTPALQFQDSDAAAGDTSVRLAGACTDTGDGSEDCDFTVGVQEAGSDSLTDIRFKIDADSGVDIGSANNDDITLVSDAGTVIIDGSVTVPTTLGLILGAAGVKFVDDGDGAVTLSGQGDGNDEDITLNLDDTADTIVASSSTGVTKLDMGAIGVELNQDVNLTLHDQTLDHDGTDFVFSDTLEATGFHPTTTLTECIMLDAAGITCLDTGGCTDPADIDGTNFSFKTAAFATGADDCGSWAFELPDNFSGTTASVTFIWFSDHSDCDGGAEDEVCWTIDGDSFANDAAFETGALGGTLVGITSDICTADGDIMRSAAVTFTHSMSAGETAVVLVCRDVDGGSCTGDDDYGQDAKLRAVKFCYEVDQVFSGE